jgi:AraC family transcriptional regulator
MTFLTSAVEVRSVANVARYPAGAIYGPRVMTSYEFVWLFEGSDMWETLDAHGTAIESHRLAPGVMALSPLGLAERHCWDPVGGGAHGYIHFDLPAAVTASQWPRTRVMSECPPLAALADSLFDIGAASAGVAHERTAQVIGLMLELFLSEQSSERGGRATILTDRVAHYVRQTWLQGGVRIVGITELANALGTSPGYLSRRFSDRYGVGAARGLELIRLARAAVSLQRTSMVLAEIAGQNGFTDEYHLSKRFARVYGVPPGAYRRRHSDDEPLQPIIAAQLMPLWNAVLTPTQTHAVHEPMVARRS